MKSAFISYQHDEREKVVRILNILTAATGADVWIDIDGLYVGDQYNAIIEREIQKREFFVFMASAKWFASDYCKKEFMLACALKKKIIPVYLEDCEVPPGEGFALTIAGLHYIKAYGIPDDELDRSFRGSALATPYKRGVDLYMQGDFPAAVELFRLSAENEQNKEAQYELGLCYMKGKGIEPNMKLGAGWIRKAAEGDQNSPGLSSAQLDLGRCYQYGEGVSPDHEEAMKWYLKAAQEGQDVWAMYLVGRCYDEGTGVVTDKQEALRWYEKAAAHGHAKALYELARRYDYGNDVPADPAKAASLYHQAAEMGLADAQNAYGVALFFGEGVPENKQEAASFYRQAAEQGHKYAQYNLAMCYEHGNGVKSDPVQAFIWFSKAAASGDEDAQYNVGIRFYFGIGVMKDLAQGLMWIYKAEQNGSTQAARFLQHMRGQ